MGRLIEADVFYKRYCEVYEDGVDEGEIDRIAYMLSTEPTAYDVEKVLAELEEYKKQWMDSDYLDGVDEIIDIVKAGGVE